MVETETPQTIVFFDGVCHLCNAFVDFVLSRDSKRRLRFASLQGATARNMLSENDRTKLESVVVFDRGQVLRESAAIARVFLRLGGAWVIFGGLILTVPAIFRNAVYRWVARHRTKWFGERDVCRLPLAHERDRLLD